MIKTGINQNGVRWIKQGNQVTCFYSLTSDLEISRTFLNLTYKAVQNITGIQLLNVRKNYARK
jgi:hypothetical protein